MNKKTERWSFVVVGPLGPLDQRSSMDPKVDPWTTMTVLDPRILGPEFCIQTLQNCEACWKEKTVLWSTEVTRTLDSPDH